MYKSKKIKIGFYIDSSLIDLLPTITIYSNEKSITFRWIIFEINIDY